MMIRAFLLIILSPIAFLANAQLRIVNVSLTDTSRALLYTGVENQIVIFGARDGKLTFSGNDIKIINSIHYNYFIYANKPGFVTISFTAYRKAPIKKQFEIVPINEKQVATLGGVRDTTVSLNFVLANPFIIGMIPHCYWDAMISIRSFDATFIYGNDRLTRTAQGDKLSTEQISLFKTLETGDKVYFDSIRALDRDSRTYLLPSFWIKIE